MYKVSLRNSVFALAFIFASCNQSQQSSETVKADSVSTVSAAPAVPVELKDPDSNKAYELYIKLKDVLVKSSSAEARAAAKELSVVLHKLPNQSNAATLSDKIAESSDLKDQRVNFTTLSNDLIVLFKQAEVNSGTMFVQYCPMANDGEGAYWLASEEEIRNPYYGDEMLNCGEVKESIKKK